MPVCDGDVTASPSHNPVTLSVRVPYRFVPVHKPATLREWIPSPVCVALQTSYADVVIFVAGWCSGGRFPPWLELYIRIRRFFLFLLMLTVVSASVETERSGVL